MATVVPPKSKRQKLVESEKIKEQRRLDVVPEDLGSIRLQFRASDTGENVAGQISVPVTQGSTRNLETLLNTLLGTVCTCQSF
jgi:ribosome assembly protein 4